MNTTPSPFQITKFIKSNGRLTKRISLINGELKSDSSECLMPVGRARRVHLANLTELARLIESLSPCEAISLGALRPGFPHQIGIATKRSLDRRNGKAAGMFISRTGENIVYLPDQQTVALIDYDTKAMPSDVRRRVDGYQTPQAALISVLPGLSHAAGVIRRSTSSGLRRTDTGELLRSSGGLHWFVQVQDGSDIERFLRVAHDRCWLHGMGWYMLGAAAQLLERSLVDRMVYASERLVFEAGPVLVGDLEQDQAMRRAQVIPGEAIDTRKLCPDLNTAERAQLRDAKAQAAHRLAKQAAIVKAKYISERSAALVASKGISPLAARRVIEKQCEGILLPDLELPFDYSEFVGATVSDVLADPDKFVGATLADPQEGIDYGRTKAKVMRRPDGTIWINSYAHGRTSYDLKHDARSIEATINRTDPSEVAATFVDLLLASDIDADQEQLLREMVCERSGVKPKPLTDKIKAARSRRAAEAEKEAKLKRTAERVDPRVQMTAPSQDAERLPVMAALDHVLGHVQEPEPPMRDMEGRPVEIRTRRPLLLHELTGSGANAEEATDSRLPAPELPLLTSHDKFSLSHLIEQHIEYVDRDGKPVALHPTFVEHYAAYRDSTLPRVSSVVTAPLVLDDGTLLAPNGLDRARGIVFRNDSTLLSMLLPREECTQAAVAEAMDYLVNWWLVDIATDFSGKCTLIAFALTILERVLLEGRPSFSCTAGQRGGGKTTTIAMIVLAVTGKRPAAAAWSPNDEERRKALLAYLSEGLDVLCWDNIPRGAAISCPHIEKALTSSTYSDRILGGSKYAMVPSTTVMAFTGNNTTMRGDLASRNLTVRINVEQPDPENRDFVHEDPLGWTLANRGAILQALYVVLLGNPQLCSDTQKKRDTRFKHWWHLIGSAVENGAYAMMLAEADDECTLRETVYEANLLLKPEHHIGISDHVEQGVSFKEIVRFKDMFIKAEGGEEQTSGVAGMLEHLRTKWSEKFTAADVAKYLNSTSMDAPDAKVGALRCYIEQASGKAMPPVVSSTIVSWRLKLFVDLPTRMEDGSVQRLRMTQQHSNAEFTVEKIIPKAG